jgi:hyperosmotically inducible periplasmic protein
MKCIHPRMLNLAFAGALGAFTAATASAAPAMPDFKTTDSNGDNMISLKEFQAQGGHEQAFIDGDVNRDKRLDTDEYFKAVATNERLNKARAGTDGKKAGEYVDDAWITAKVKTLLLKDEGVKGLDVNVETHKGTVQLSGVVSSPTQIVQAERVARSVEGVKDVSNSLQLKR